MVEVDSGGKNELTKSEQMMIARLTYYGGGSL